MNPAMSEGAKRLAAGKTKQDRLRRVWDKEVA